MIARPEGIVFVTGPTGSGKTTTLYSVLNHINSEGVNIMTLEDPVEYPMTLVRQTSAADSVKLDFANGIRSMMRQDPDIILVGEVRDAETAEMALRAAMTGHQVYSTLHTNSAHWRHSPPARHRHLPDIMAGNIIGIIAQRLVRRLCVHCKIPYQAEAHETRLLGNLADGPRPVIYRPGGCERCEFQGYRGRLAIMELLRINGDMDELIARRSTVREMRSWPTARALPPSPMTACARSRRLDLARGSRPRRRPDRPDVAAGAALHLQGGQSRRADGSRQDRRHQPGRPRNALRRMELDLVSGEPVSNRSLLARGGVPRREIIHFCFHLQQLVRAGVPIIEGLTDLRDSLEHPRFREVVASLIEVDRGRADPVAGHGRSSAASSMPVFVSLIRAGETTGRLPEVLHSLNESLKWEDELASQTKKMIAYPAFVGAIVLAATFFLMVYMVPQLKMFVKNMGQVLPTQTVVLFFISDLMVAYWYLLLLLPAYWRSGCASCCTAIRWHAFASMASSWLPVVGNILRKIALSRFANTFALLYASGIPILESIRTTQDVVGNLVIRQRPGARRTVDRRGAERDGRLSQPPASSRRW
jgi:type II secretory pathway component PulF/energy-coupling factor transporter ATP-binding protein EcfA2